MNIPIPSGRAVASSRLRLHPVHRILAAGLSAVLAVLLQWVPAAHADPPVVTLTRLHSFGDPLTDAAGSPHSRPIEGSDGALYGTTYQGGATGYGTVFRVNKDGTGFAVLKCFNLGTDGVNPVGGVTEGSDGALYGTAYQGGASGYGAVFRVSKDGTGFAVLKSLNGGTDGRYFHSGVTEGSDGALFGTAIEGGLFDFGTVFRVNKDGTGFAVLKSFDLGTSGLYAYGGVVEGSDGALYGTTALAAGGTVYRLNKDGSGFAVLKTLDSATDGAVPVAFLIEGGDGVLYGTARDGGAHGGGTVFRMNKDGTGFAVLKSLNGGTDGGFLNSEVTEGSDGALYGTAQLGLRLPQKKRRDKGSAIL